MITDLKYVPYIIINEPFIPLKNSGFNDSSPKNASSSPQANKNYSDYKDLLKMLRRCSFSDIWWLKTSEVALA